MANYRERYLQTELLKNGFGGFGVFHDFRGFYGFGGSGLITSYKQESCIQIQVQFLGTIQVIITQSYIITGCKHRVFTHTGIILCSNSDSISCKQESCIQIQVQFLGYHTSNHYTKLHHYWVQTQSVYTYRNHIIFRFNYWLQTGIMYSDSGSIPGVPH